MIHITIKYDNAFDIQIQRHAGYAVKGHDIVCAAISTLYQTLVLAFQEYAYDGFQRGLFQTSLKTGWLHANLNNGNRYLSHIHNNCDCEFAVNVNMKFTNWGCGQNPGPKNPKGMLCTHMKKD